MNRQERKIATKFDADGHGAGASPPHSIRLTSMQLPPNHGRWPLILLCVALLVVRVGGAHLHLCFDGNEPPVSFHPVEDSDHHDEAGLSASHDDTDVALSAASIAKSGKQILDLSLLALLPFLMCLLLPQMRQLFFTSAPRLLPTLAFHLRPPLRGPPA